MPPKKKPKKKPKRKSVDCELFFMLRVHGKDGDKTITVKSQKDWRGHQLLPLFGINDHQEEFHKLIHHAFAPPSEVRVFYAGDVPSERECLDAARRSVPKRLSLGVQAQGIIQSKWNPETRRWDPPPPPAPPHAASQKQFAFGYVITKRKQPVQSYVIVDDQTLFVDFVVCLQGQVSP